MPQKTAIVSSFLTEFALAHYFVEAAEELGIPYQKFTQKEQKSIGPEFDFILYIDDGSEYVVYPHPHALKAFYIVDTHLGIEDDLSMLKFVDVIFCAQKNAVSQLEHLGIPVHWLPLACSDKYHHHPEPVEKIYDIGFVGNDGFGRRKEIISEIRELYPNSYIGRAPRAEIGKIYAQSRIVLNVAINNDINMRFFEALCSGSFLLTENINENGQEDLKNSLNEKFFIDYQDIHGLREKIDYYLANSDQREQIASSGREFAKLNQYQSRIQTIFKTIESNKYSVMQKKNSDYLLSKTKLVFKKISNRIQNIF